MQSEIAAYRFPRQSADTAMPSTSLPQPLRKQDVSEYFSESFFPPVNLETMRLQDRYAPPDCVVYFIAADTSLKDDRNNSDLSPNA